MKKWALMILVIMLLSVQIMPGMTEAAETAENEITIPFRFVSKEEGLSLMLGNTEYYARNNENKLEYVMQRKGVTEEEYMAFAKEQVLEWTDAEKDLITLVIHIIEDRFEDYGWKMPPMETIEFIKTTMLEEGEGIGGYTHGTQIYLGDFVGDYAAMDMPEGEALADFAEIVIHEVFHCMTRCNPDFRRGMYGIIHFTVEDKDYELPPSVWEYYINNPDVEHHNAHATFLIDGDEAECFTAFVTTKHFENQGEQFFDNGTTALVPVDGTDIWYPKDGASNFDEVFGLNTGYVIDPEECMADNFKYAVLYGESGPNGEGYANPEIIEAIDRYMRGE